MKNKKFKINYSFDGVGEVMVLAKNKKEAEEIFYNGGWENEQESGDQYTADAIEEA